MTRQSEAIVLRTYPLREADLLVTLFTRSDGKIRGVANGARRAVVGRLVLHHGPAAGGRSAGLVVADLKAFSASLRESRNRGRVQPVYDASYAGAV